MNKKSWIKIILISLALSIIAFLLSIKYGSGCFDCAQQPSVWEILSNASLFTVLIVFIIIWVLIFVILLIVWNILLFIRKKFKAKTRSSHNQQHLIYLL